MIREFREDVSVTLTVLTSFCAEALFSHDTQDTVSAKCVMVGVWLFGVVWHEIMKHMIRGVFGGR